MLFHGIICKILGQIFKFCRGQGMATQLFTEAEAEGKSSFLDKTEAEDLVDH